jgi:hypothetical protein
VQVVTSLNCRNCLRAQLQPKLGTDAPAPGFTSTFGNMLVSVTCVNVPGSCGKHIVPVLLLTQGSLQHGRTAGLEAIPRTPRHLMDVSACDRPLLRVRVY